MKTYKHFLLLFISTLFFVGCQDDVYESGDDVGGGSSNNSVSLNMSSLDEVIVSRSAGTATEDSLADLRILVYRGTKGTTPYVKSIYYCFRENYKITPPTHYAWRDGPDKDKILYNGTNQPVVSFGDFSPKAGDRLYLIAGAIGGPSTSDESAKHLDIPVTATENELDDLLSVESNILVRVDTFTTNLKYFYGEIENWNTNGSNVCSFVRNFAKYEIIRAGDALTMPIDNIFSYNVPKGSKIMYPKNGASFNFNTPETFIYERYLGLFVNPESKGFLAEWPSSTNAKGNTISNTEWNTDRVCMIIASGGGYYRLDFIDRSTGKYIDIKRNHSYVWYITKVLSEPYKTIEEALANPGSNLEYAVVENSISQNKVNSNGQYAISLSNDRCIIHGDDNETYNIATVRSINIAPGTISTNSITATTGISDLSVTSLTSAYAELNVKLESGFESGNIYINYGNLKDTISVVRKPKLSFLFNGIVDSLTVDNGVDHSLSASITDASNWLRFSKNGISYDQSSYYKSNGFYVVCPENNLGTDKLNRSAVIDVVRSYDKGHTRIIVNQIAASEYSFKSSLTTVPALYTGVSPSGGTTTALNIESYYKYQGVIYPLPWTSDIIKPDGTIDNTIPNWYSGMDFTSAGSSDAGQDFTVTITPQQVKKPTPILQATAPVSDYDLSTHDINGNLTSMNTANCYVLFGPGTYKFPVVYGNGIKNGLTNSKAYESNSSGPHTLEHFINSKGNAITDPWIKNNADCTPADACLCWQDEQNLVTGIALSGDYITFTVSSATIKEGNAVIAVRDASNEILWSWHIWVTSDKEGFLSPQTFPNYSGTRVYSYMNMALGSCELSTDGYYPSRVSRVRLKNALTGDIEYVTFAQYPYYNSLSTALFQSARKDAFLGTAIEYMTIRHQFYDNNEYRCRGSNVWNEANLQYTDIQRSIKEPYQLSFNGNNQGISTLNLTLHTLTADEMLNNLFSNLWNSTHPYEYEMDWSVLTGSTNDTCSVVEKTIYDPSPVGYHAPSPDAYSFLKFPQSRYQFKPYGNGVTHVFTDNNGNMMFISKAGGRDQLGNESMCSSGSYDLPSPVHRINFWGSTVLGYSPYYAQSFVPVAD